MAVGAARAIPPFRGCCTPTSDAVVLGEAGRWLNGHRPDER